MLAAIRQNATVQWALKNEKLPNILLAAGTLLVITGIALSCIPFSIGPLPFTLWKTICIATGAALLLTGIALWTIRKCGESPPPYVLEVKSS